MTPENKAEFDITMLTDIESTVKKHGFTGLNELDIVYFAMMIEIYIQGAKEALVITKKIKNEQNN